MPTLSVEPTPAPPVIEVALAIEFVPIQELGPVGLARLASEWASDYPIMREVPALPPSTLNPGMGTFQFMTGPSPSRIWLLTPAGNDLLQIQNDRLIINWRRLDSELVYPGHQDLLTKMRTRWREFIERLSEVGLPSPSPTIAEWTYVNHLDREILARRGLSFFNDNLEELPGQSNSFAFEITRDLTNEERSGFLAVTGASSASSAAAEPVFSLTITTKLSLQAADLMGAVDILSQAHDVSRVGFDKITSAAARTEWGLDS